MHIISKMKAWNNNQQTVVCIVCGTTKIVSPSRVKGFKYCSKACLYKRAVKKVKVIGVIAYIDIGQGKESIIDAQDVGLVADNSWYINTSGYAGRRKWNNTDGVWSAEYQQLHRLIMQPGSGLEVDHINGNRLDNRRCNLRVATHQQNMANKGVSKRSSTGYKGVYATGRRYEARIKYHDNEMRLGIFDTPEEANVAYQRKAVELHGDFAKTRD